MKKASLIVFFLGLLVQSLPLAAATPIDLTALDVYARRGFDESWVSKLPAAEDKGWILVPGQAGNRPLRVMDLGFAEMPERKIFSTGLAPQDFTFIFTFDLDEQDLAGKALGLHLAQIGQNWEIFLNGTSLKREIWLNDDGSIRYLRAVRNQVVEFPHNTLKPGRNILAVRIIGDPTLDRTGLFMGRDYIIDKVESLQVKRDETLNFMLYAIFLFFGLYHLLLYIRRRKDVHNLSFGLATILLAVYNSFRSPQVFDLIKDTWIIKSVELVAMYMMLALFIMFLDRLIREHVTLFTKIFLIFSILVSVLSLPFEKEFLLVWQILMVICALPYMLLYDILLPFLRALRQYYREYHSSGWVMRIIRTFGNGMLISIPGNLLLGMGILFITGMLDTIHLKSGNPTTYTRYGFFVLIIGLVIMLANRFLNVYQQVEELNVTLEEKVVDRTKKLQSANEELEAAMHEMEAMNENLVQVNRDLEEAQRIAAMDMRMAVHVQTSFFPKNPPSTPHWEVACIFKPMAGVSGDLYDFYYDNNELHGVALFDVSGHGIASGLITMLAKSVIHRRFSLGKNQKLNLVIEEINRDLINEIGNVDNYLTGVLLRLQNDCVEYVNAGHTDLLFRRGSDGAVRVVEPKNRDFKGFYLGIEAMESKFKALSFNMAKDDMLLVYCDCLNESKNDTGEEYGVERIMESLRQMPAGLNAQQGLEHIVQEFQAYIGACPLDDDFTVVMIRRVV